MVKTNLLLSVLALGITLPLCGADDIQQAVKIYAHFYSRNSSDTLEGFKNCFVPSERSNVYILPSEQEKSASTDEAVIVSSRQQGNFCKVKYHTGDPNITEQAVLEQHNGQWFISFTRTAELRKNLQKQCSGKLQQLGKALQHFSQLKAGRFPDGNDAAGWEELRQQNLIKSAEDYHCPQCNKVYSYMGGKSIDSNSDSPVAWCDKHLENDNVSNVLLLNGNIKAMPSPAAYVPTAAEVPAAAPVAAAAPAAERSSAAAAALLVSEQPAPPVNPANWQTSDKRSNYPISRTAAAVSTQNAADHKSAAPKHWLKGPTPDWYIHLDDAVAAARRTGRKIYALHTGSDWCPPCKNLEKNILSTAKFKKFAKDNLILLFVDSPMGKPIPKDQDKYNRALVSKLKFGRGVPAILLLNSDGNPLGKIGGRSNTATHIKAIKKALELFQ